MAEDNLGQEGLPAFLESVLRRLNTAPERRPRVHEMDRLEVRDIRALVHEHQPKIELTGAGGLPLVLKLTWLERWGGTFGPRSSAEANHLRSTPRSDRAEADDNPDRVSDRGQRPALLLYLLCPMCSRRCRVLYSLRGKDRYGCPKCNRPAWASNCWSPSGSKKAQQSRQRERKRLQHLQAARRIRRLYLNDHGPRQGSLLAPAIATLQKPRGMTWERFTALANLVEAHETLALMAALGNAEAALGRLAPELKTPADPDSERQERSVKGWAYVILQRDAWALRQTSWKRRGLSSSEAKKQREAESAQALQGADGCPGTSSDRREPPDQSEPEGRA